MARGRSRSVFASSWWVIRRMTRPLASMGQQHQGNRNLEVARDRGALHLAAQLRDGGSHSRCHAILEFGAFKRFEIAAFRGQFHGDGGRGQRYSKAAPELPAWLQEDLFFASSRAMAWEADWLRSRDAACAFSQEKKRPAAGCRGSGNNGA